MKYLLYIGLTLCCALGQARELKITARSWLVADGLGHILQSENIQEVRSIASITKLMTVMVVADAQQDSDQVLEKYTRRDLIQMALVHSDNHAAEVLCDYYPGGRDACVRAMNQKAQGLGMANTAFIEPTGLSVFNVSTAEQLIKLVQAAQDYPVIRQAAQSPQIRIRLRRRWMIFNNTNPIIGHRYNFLVSKTGYIRASGGCIIMMMDTDVGRRMVILLGSRNTHTRIPEAEFIANQQ